MPKRPRPAAVDDEAATAAESASANIADDGTGLVAPGDRLGAADALTAGEGCYVWGSHIRASLAGVVSRDETQQPPVVSVTRRGAATSSIVPAVGDHVTCRIVRINTRQAQLEIVCVGGTALREPLGGLIRREDVRDYDRDGVQVYKCFRPGDVVLGRVISLGDSRFYFVTTADPPLGVVFARSAEGHTMVPVSHEEVLCPVTKTREWRKVAKPATATQPDDSAPSPEEPTGEMDKR